LKINFYPDRQSLESNRKISIKNRFRVYNTMHQQSYDIIQKFAG